MRCSGYRSLSDLLFRDETRTIIRKCHISKTGTASKGSHAGDPSPGFLSPSMRIEEIAQKIFFDNFPIMTGSCSRAMEAGVWKSSSAIISITSVGLAVLAVVHKDPNVMDLARRKYSLALKLLTKAVVDPMQFGIEQSTAASFILSIFEVSLPVVVGNLSQIIGS